MPEKGRLRRAPEGASGRDLQDFLGYFLAPSQVGVGIVKQGVGNQS
jgi:hypothetical protein